MSAPTLRSRLAATLAVGALGIAGFAVLGPSPASAVPGDAAAVGIASTLDVSVAQGAVNASVDGSLGAVNAPPTASSHLVNATLGSAIASVNAKVIDTEATSTPAASSSTSAITGAQVVVPALTPLLGGVLVDTGANVIRATANCPTGGTPTATVDPLAGVLVAGQTVIFDANGDADILLSVAGLPVGDVALHLHDTITTSNTASAAALRLSFDVNVPTVASVTGSVTIAQANCVSSTATSTVPALTDIDPNQGPTAGGTSVTLTGTAFVPGQTSVTIGGNTVPAVQVDVDPSGTSLTFTTPAHGAGLVDVTVTTSGGTSPALGYTYVPPLVAVVPTTTGIVPDQGPTSGGTPVTPTADPDPGPLTYTYEAPAPAAPGPTAGNGNDPGKGNDLGNATNANRTGSGTTGARRTVSQPAAAARTLARTGTDIVPLALAGLGTVLLGGAFLALRRRLAGGTTV